MSIEIVLEGQLEKETDKEAFSAFLKQVCDEKKLKLEDYVRRGTLNAAMRTAL